MERPKRKIIAVDCDGTLTKEVCWTPEDCLNATPRNDVIAKVNKLYFGNVVIIYTARDDSLLPATVQWLREHGVRYWGISNQKLPSDVYIDDLGVSPDTFDENI